MSKIPTIAARVKHVASAKRNGADVVLLVVQADEWAGDTTPRILSLDVANARKTYVRLGRILQGLKKGES